MRLLDTNVLEVGSSFLPSFLPSFPPSLLPSFVFFLPSCTALHYPFAGSFLFLRPHFPRFFFFFRFFFIPSTPSFLRSPPPPPPLPPPSPLSARITRTVSCRSIIPILSKNRTARIWWTKREDSQKQKRFGGVDGGPLLLLIGWLAADYLLAIDYFDSFLLISAYWMADWLLSVSRFFLENN